MNWLAGIWIAVLCYLYVGGALDDARAGVRPWKIGLDLVNFVVSDYLILVYFFPRGS